MSADVIVPVVLGGVALFSGVVAFALSKAGLIQFNGWR